MEIKFGSILAGLRRGSGLNQRQLAAELKISQALLSQYENGGREPGLPFLCRVCDYFGVTADFILGRSDSAEGGVRRSAGERELSILLDNIDRPDIYKASQSYTDAASHRLASVLKGNLKEAVSAGYSMAAAERDALEAMSNKGEQAPQ